MVTEDLEISLSEERRLFAQSIKEIAENEFADKAFTWEGEAPWENLQYLAEHGFHGINFDEKYGGQGMSTFDVVIATDIIGKVCPQTANFFAGLHMMAPRAIHMFGTEEAKEKYLPPVAAAEDCIAIAISEPEAGSDVGSMKTTVTEEDGELILDGEKIWVSRVPDSSAAVVWTKFPEGLGTVILEFDSPGVEITERYTNMAGKTQVHFFMDDVKIPPENVVTRGKEGFKKQLKALNWERFSGAAYTNASARCALDMALEYAQSREQFGQPISEFQGIEWKLADMYKKVKTSRTLMYRIAKEANERGEPPSRLDASTAWLKATETADYVVDQALQIHGARGYQKGHPLEYLYRRVRGSRIGGGTDEIQRNAIASELKSKNG